MPAQCWFYWGERTKNMVFVGFFVLFFVVVVVVLFLECDSKILPQSIRVLVKIHPDTVSQNSCMIFGRVPVTS